tara:strand:+ start:323 stop:1240 length:918 start_codon:yes stop_codon:yes gene_type:complete
MKTVTSISGGMTSAYVAVNYPSDFNWFALVTTTDTDCAFTDPACSQYIQEKTGSEVIGTLEDDMIIYTMMDLEQYMGRSIDMVVGSTFDDVVEHKGGWLPNKLHRYCTVEMKLRPLFRQWRSTCTDPVKMQIGFRANEQRRANNMKDRLNDDGLLEFKDVVGKHPNGKNKWETIAWQTPTFPLIDDGIFKDQIVEFWKDKPVRFAPLNNCVGCFHRNPLLLRQMFEAHPNKMSWFNRKEQEKLKILRQKSASKGVFWDEKDRLNGRLQGTWKSEMKYEEIKKHRTQMTLDLEEWESDCDSGHCGL